MLQSLVHCLRREQTLPVDLDAAWSFFSDPLNLPRLTPGWLAFRVTCDPAQPAYAGQILTYTVSPFPGLRLGWVTEITHCRAPSFFVDEQRLGPYRFWHHQHRFTPLPEGGTRMEDLVHYALPLGALGRLLEPWLVRPRLEAIFDFRRRALEAAFPPPPGRPDP